MNHMISKIKESPHAKIFILVGFCIAAALLYVTSQSQQPATDTEPKLESSIRAERKMSQIVGGLGGVIEKNDEVTEVVNKIKPILEEKTGLTFESLEVIHFKPQVVAGKNYFVKAKAKPVVGDEQIVHLRIYQDLQRELELTAYQLGRKLEEELAYFQ